MKTTSNRRMGEIRRLTLLRLAMATAASLAVALVPSACVNVATYTQPSLVRVIDASYIAPSSKCGCGSTLLASNIGQGTIRRLWHASGIEQRRHQWYRPQPAARRWSPPMAPWPPAISTPFFSPTTARLQQVTRSRCLKTNRLGCQRPLRLPISQSAPKTGGVDVYMIPSGTTLANTILSSPICP